MPDGSLGLLLCYLRTVRGHALPTTIYLEPGVRLSGLTIEVLPFVASFALTAIGDHRRLSILPIRPAHDMFPVWLGGWIHCSEREFSSFGKANNYISRLSKAAAPFLPLVAVPCLRYNPG